jgi:type II secretion system protein N
MAHVRRSWIIAGYICYAVGLFALFTYLNFPSQQVRSYIVTTLGQVGLDQVWIGDVEPLLPAGLRFREVSVAYHVGGQALELVRFSALQVRLRKWWPFTNAVHLGFEGGLYGGHILGAVKWEQNGETSGLGLRADLRDIRPAAHPLAARWGLQSLESRLAGNIALQLADQRWRTGNGRLIIQGEGGTIAGIEVKGMRLPPLAYEQLTGELLLAQQNLVVKEFVLRGRDWQLEVQGQIAFQEILRQSPLDLTLRVRTSEPLEQQLGMLGMVLKQRRDRRGFSAFKIGGTLENPSAML